MNKFFDILQKFSNKPEKQTEVTKNKNALVIERLISKNISIGISKILIEMTSNTSNTSNTSSNKKWTKQALQLKYNDLTKLFGLYAFNSYENALSYDFVNYEDKDEFARLVITYIPPDTLYYNFTLYKLLKTNQSNQANQSNQTNLYSYTIGFHGVLKNYKPFSLNNIELDKIHELMKNKSN